MSNIKPGFYALKHLMGYGGGPDLNKRFIHHYPPRGRTDDETVICNASDPEKGWTEKDDRALDAYLAVLNEPEP
jgi:hypothetical protein